MGILVGTIRWKCFEGEKRGWRAQSRFHIFCGWRLRRGDFSWHEVLFFGGFHQFLQLESSIKGCFDHIWIVLSLFIEYIATTSSDEYIFKLNYTYNIELAAPSGATNFHPIHFIVGTGLFVFWTFKFAKYFFLLKHIILKYVDWNISWWKSYTRLFHWGRWVLLSELSDSRRTKIFFFCNITTSVYLDIIITPLMIF